MTRDNRSVREGFDIAVIGAGPCGLSVGVAAKQAGLSCVVLDRASIVAGIAAYPTYGTFFSTPNRLELGGVPFIVAEDKPTRREALKYYRRVAQHFRIDVRQYEEVLTVSGEEGAFVLDTRQMAGGEKRYTAANVVVATGYYGHPNLLGVAGEDLPKVTHYYTEAHPYTDQDCLVVGGGNSAVEAALDLYRAGARVGLLHFEDRLDRGVKPWILPDITNRLARGEITAYWRRRIAEIGPQNVTLRSEDDGTLSEVKNDWVIAMTGYMPDPRLLRELGVTFDSATGVPDHDPTTMATNVPGVFIAGVVAGGNRPDQIFIEDGRDHGPRIIETLGATRARSASVAP